MTSKLIAYRSRYRRNDELISAGGRNRAGGDTALRSHNQLAGDSPIPTLALAAEADAADVQNGIRNERSEGAIWTGFAAIKIAGGHEPSIFQVTGGADFVVPALSPIELEWQIKW